MREKHVAVLMGGFSSERPVSLSSGNACADALEKEGYRVTRVDVGRDVGQVLAELRPDVAFNALHGPFGEDGTIQGILEYLAIPYTHSGVLASALAMNKEQAKTHRPSIGIPVAESRVLNRLAIRREHPMKPPYVVKPVNEGSSFGVVIVKESQSHPPQVDRLVRLEVWRRGHGRALRSRPRAHLRRDGRCGARRHRDHPGRAFLLRLRFEICGRADQNTYARQKFHQIFTKKYRHWR